ncbi:major capsid protein [robinz microvirus RP_175]|nr:major capsid protein [robinz microvirus RP_175]
MKRSKFSLSNYKLCSMNQGILVPINWYEVLPGDSVQAATSALVRVAPLVSPVMHPVHARIHHWFVPNRLMWEDWEDFITGGPDGMDDSEWPHITPNGTVASGSLSDYLGVPPGSYAGPVSGFSFSALPFRAYNNIINEWYRDQDLVTERVTAKTSGPQTGLVEDTSLFQIAWEKDYFTSARPWTQKGPEVTLPLGTSAPVVGTGAPTFLKGAGGASTHLAANNTDDFIRAESVAGGTPGPMPWDNPQLSVNLAGATSATVNDLREAMAIQRYEEARARYGARYSEYLRYLGVRSSDARLQRPEYLGGGKQTIHFSEVLQTAEGADPVGMLRGHGIGALRSNRFRRFFEEHGIVMSLMSVKPVTVYNQSMKRGWFRQVKEDYWQKELEHIGQQAVWNSEVYSAHADPFGTFGYQDRYDEYRRQESSIGGEFRDILNYWHMARDFSAAPVLNGDFVTSNPTDRIYAAASPSHQLYVMAQNSVKVRRMLSKTGTSHIF